MRSRLLSICAVAAALLTGATAANAGILRFEGVLRGANETPPNATGGRGEIVAAVDTDRGVLDYTVTYAGLTGPATAAGLHEVVPNQPDPVIPAPASGASGQVHAVVKLTSDQLAALNAGRWSFEIATDAHPGGEIRAVLRRGD
jgi:hypothetical protein